jgi:DNA-directed RNA polymerase specialized sigma24 family protein
VPALTTALRQDEQVLGPAAEAAQALHERFSGQVFGYCLGRLGGRREAETAVEKTFLKAARALARGEAPGAGHELAWLLRFAERICASRRRLAWIRARADGPPLITPPPDAAGAPIRIVRDWEGLTFDEIAADYEARQDLVAKARADLVSSMSPWRRPLAVLDLGAAFGWIKSALTGASIVKSTAAAVAVTASVVVVATPVGDRLHDAVRPASPSTPARDVPARDVRGGNLPAAAPHSRPQPTVKQPHPASKTASSKPSSSAPSGSKTPAGGAPAAEPATPAGAQQPVSSPTTPSEPSPAAPSTPAGQTPEISTPEVPPQAPAVQAPTPEPPPVVTTPLPEPQVEAPMPTVPQVETPAVPPLEAPKVEAPKVEAPKVETPKVETPKLP